MTVIVTLKDTVTLIVILKLIVIVKLIVGFTKSGSDNNNYTDR